MAVADTHLRRFARRTIAAPARKSPVVGSFHLYQLSLFAVPLRSSIRQRAFRSPPNGCPAPLSRNTA
jgi:hypothetical protein